MTPEAAGLPAHDRDAIRGGDAAFNAQALRKLLAGERAASRDAVLMNAAGALIVADAAGTWHGGAEPAAAAIDSGRAAADRTSVVEGKSGSVRVDLGGRGITKNTTKNQSKKRR